MHESVRHRQSVKHLALPPPTRNGTSGKTVLTDEGPVDIEVPRDREGSYEPFARSCRSEHPACYRDVCSALAANLGNSSESNALHRRASFKNTGSLLPRTIAMNCNLPSNECLKLGGPRHGAR